MYIRKQEFQIYNPIIFIPTKDRPRSLSRCLASLKENGNNIKVVVLGDHNGTTSINIDNNKKICTDYKAEYTDHTKKGLNAIYNLGISIAQKRNYDTFVFCNDDVVFYQSSWWPEVAETLDKEPYIVPFCRPNGWSAVAFTDKLIKAVGGFLDEGYKSGGWEDDDLCLTLAAFCCKIPSDAYSEKLIHYRNLVAHRPIGEGSQWNHSINSRYFHTKWKEVNSDHPAARRRKQSDKYYVPIVI